MHIIIHAIIFTTDVVSKQLNSFLNVSVRSYDDVLMVNILTSTALCTCLPELDNNL